MIDIKREDDKYMIDFGNGQSKSIIEEEYVNISEDKIELSFFNDDEVTEKDAIKKLLPFNWNSLFKGYKNYVIAVKFSANFQISYIESLITYIEIEKQNSTLFIRFNTIPIDEFPYSWNEKWSIDKYFEQLLTLNSEYPEIYIIRNEKYHNDEKIYYLTIETSTNKQENIESALSSALYSIDMIHNSAWLKLEGFVWKSQYENDEQYFSQDLLFHLFVKLGFKNVFYSHGTREYGRDFIFCETNKLGLENYYGVQVKAGNVSGSVNSQIDELIGQLTDAYTMPFYTLNSKEPKYISTFIIVISGYFSQNAREKILQKVSNLHGKIMGSLYFLDKDKIIELMRDASKNK
jgi:hypothetical protein